MKRVKWLSRWIARIAVCAVVVGGIVGISRTARAGCPGSDCVEGLVSCTQTATGTLQECLSACSPRSGTCAQACAGALQTSLDACRTTFQGCSGVCPPAPSSCAACGAGFSDCVQLVVGNLVSCLSGARGGTAAQACLLAAQAPFAVCQAGLSSCIGDCTQ
jgi:hypothetical protein